MNLKKELLPLTSNSTYDLKPLFLSLYAEAIRCIKANEMEQDEEEAIEEGEMSLSPIAFSKLSIDPSKQSLNPRALKDIAVKRVTGLAIVDYLTDLERNNEIIISYVGPTYSHIHPCHQSAVRLASLQAGVYAPLSFLIVEKVGLPYRVLVDLGSEGEIDEDLQPITGISVTFHQPVDPNIFKQTNAWFDQISDCILKKLNSDKKYQELCPVLQRYFTHAYSVNLAQNISHPSAPNMGEKITFFTDLRVIGYIPIPANSDCHVTLYPLSPATAQYAADTRNLISISTTSVPGLIDELTIFLTGYTKERKGQEDLLTIQAVKTLNDLQAWPVEKKNNSSDAVYALFNYFSQVKRNLDVIQSHYNKTSRFTVKVIEALKELGTMQQMKKVDAEKSVPKLPLQELPESDETPSTPETKRTPLSYLFTPQEDKYWDSAPITISENENTPS